MLRVFIALLKKWRALTISDPRSGRLNLNISTASALREDHVILSSLLPASYVKKMLSELPSAFWEHRTHCKKCCNCTLENQVALGVLRSSSILIAAAKDLVDETLVNIELASEDLLIYGVLASA